MNLTLDDIEQIETGNYIRKVDKYFNYFYTNKSNLSDYLNNNYMVCLGYADFMLNLGHMLGENYCIMHCPRTF